MMTYEKEVVKELAQEFQEIADGIKSLKAQLAESQAREKQAVEDLRNFPGTTPCKYCKHFTKRGEISEFCTIEGRMCFEWRGVQGKDDAV